MMEISTSELHNSGDIITQRYQVLEGFADWLEKMLEPDVEDRFTSEKEALKVLQGRDITIKKSHSGAAEKTWIY